MRAILYPYIKHILKQSMKIVTVSVHRKWDRQVISWHALVILTSSYFAYAFSRSADQNSVLWLECININSPPYVGNLSSTITSFHFPKCQKLKRKRPAYQPSWNPWSAGTIRRNNSWWSGLVRQATAATTQQSPRWPCLTSNLVTPSMKKDGFCRNAPAISYKKKQQQKI